MAQTQHAHLESQEEESKVEMPTVPMAKDMPQVSQSQPSGESPVQRSSESGQQQHQNGSDQSVSENQQLLLFEQIEPASEDEHEHEDNSHERDEGILEEENEDLEEEDESAQMGFQDEEEGQNDNESLMSVDDEQMEEP